MGPDMNTAIGSVDADATGGTVWRRRPTVGDIIAHQVNPSAKAGKVVQPKIAAEEIGRFDDSQDLINILSQQTVDGQRAWASRSIDIKRIANVPRGDAPQILPIPKHPNSPRPFCGAQHRPRRDRIKVQMV